MKFLNFFLLLWVIFALLDPDTDSESGAGYGSIDLNKSRSNPDAEPDPKHCQKVPTKYVFFSCNPSPASPGRSHVIYLCNIADPDTAFQIIQDLAPTIKHPLKLY
jgi:hypothetical protein